LRDLTLHNPLLVNIFPAERLISFCHREVTKHIISSENDEVPRQPVNSRYVPG